ncbi:MAG: hypothetical protein GQ535_00585 [Rhodobacteraceae bacterium]|nr:hypothetical protein [Paracoccaceae bacterium]
MIRSDLSLGFANAETPVNPLSIISVIRSKGYRTELGGEILIWASDHWEID